MRVSKPGVTSTLVAALIAGLAVVVSLMPANPAQAAVVLQYHHVSESTPASTSVTPKRFREHMEYLANHDFDVVRLETLVEALKKGEELPDRTVAITFDDAYESVYDTAYPLLKERDWPFTVFVNTDPLDQNKNGFTTWEQLREMADHGATIANHSTQHNHLQRRKAGESEADWRERIESEVVDAERRINEETGQNHKMVAYPYGEYNNEVKALLEKLGYTAFGQQSGPIGSHSDLRALPRFPFGGPYGEIEEFATKSQTRPMPIDSVELYAGEDLEDELDEVVVAAGARPVLVLTLTEDNLAGRINCFAGGQGAIETRGASVDYPAKQTAPGVLGITAPLVESGRFFWFSQQWLVTDKDGRWVHED